MQQIQVMVELTTVIHGPNAHTMPFFLIDGNLVDAGFEAEQGYRSFEFFCVLPASERARLQDVAFTDVIARRFLV